MVGSQRAFRCSGVPDVDRKRFNESIVEDIDARSSQLTRKRRGHGMTGEPASASGEESENSGSPDPSQTC
jgi:hypothetical protein